MSNDGNLSNNSQKEGEQSPLNLNQNDKTSEQLHLSSLNEKQVSNSTIENQNDQKNLSNTELIAIKKLLE